MTGDELQAVERRHADDEAYCAEAGEVLVLVPGSDDISFRRTHEDRGLLLAEVRRLQEAHWKANEAMIGLCAEVERQRGEATEMEAALAGLQAGGAASLASELRGCIPPRLRSGELPPGSPGEIIVRAAASMRVILDAAGRVVQEAKHRHDVYPLDGPVPRHRLPPALVDALRKLEEVTGG